MTVPVRVALATLVVAGVTALFGCGGSSSEEAEAGMESWSGAGMSFEYPASWKELDAEEMKSEGLAFVAEGPPDSEGGRPRITAYRVDARYATIRAFGKGTADTRAFEVNEGRVAGEGPFKVPGAEGGWRVETRFQAKRRDGTTDPARAIEVLAKKGETHEWNLAVVGTEESLREFDAEEVIESFRLE